MKVTKYVVVVGAVFSCSVFGDYAAAQVTDANALFADCRDGDDPSARDRTFKEGNCFGYISGVADALVPAGLYCLPSGATVGQTIDIAKLCLQEHPGERKKSAPQLIVEALREKFPCTSE